MRLLILALAILLALSGCQKTNPPGEAPTGVTVTPGDGLVVVRWDTLPDLTYWIFFQQGSTVDVATPNSFAIRRAFSPRVVGPLVNGTQYAFVMNATHNDSAAGPNSFPVARTPMLAGDNWSSGTALGAPPQNLKSLAFAGGRLVTVGDAATIFWGDFNYTNDIPSPGLTVTGWTQATPPAGFASNLSSVIFANGAFVALGADGKVILSADGITWAAASGVIPAVGMNDLAFGFVSQSIPTFIAVGDGGKIFTSTDNLASWNPVPSGASGDLKSISLLNASFVVTGTNGTLLKNTSPDLGTWGLLQSNTTSTLRGAVFNPNSQANQYVAVGDAGTIVATNNLGSPGTNDLGSPWTAITLTPPLTQDLRSVTVGGASASRFLAVGQGGAVVHCDDGQNWLRALPGLDPLTPSLAKVMFLPGLYLAVGDAGANVVSR